MKLLKSLIYTIVFVGVVYAGFVIVNAEYNPFAWEEEQRTYYALYGIFFGILLGIFTLLDQTVNLNNKKKHGRK